MSSPAGDGQKNPNEQETDNEKWFNEYPLEGDPHRPAVIMTNLLSKSPRLIGWNDERIEERALSAWPDYPEGRDETELHIGPRREVVNEVAFGLLGIAAKEVTKQLLHREENRERAKPEDEEATLEGSDEHETTNPDTVGAAQLQDEISNYDESKMRDTGLYQLAMRSLLWQRDNYLVGREYADQRTAQRRRRQQELNAFPPSSAFGLPFSRLPYDATALGNQQLVRLGSWFIPSPVVHRALLPIVVGLPTGPLNEPILRATANLIPLSQNNLDRIMKERILWFLKDEQWRSVIKNSTEGYIHSTYRDSPNR